MIFTVIGARPQFVKAAAVSRQFLQKGIQEFILHTGQHYDYKMNDVFFSELGLPGADINLNAGSGTHGEQTASMLTGIEKVLIEKKKDVKYVLVYGDTNSTIAAALAAAKLNIPVIHVEAGLRSFNRTMPEEINRVMTDHLSSVLFCSSDTGKKQLAKEGIQNEVHVVGDIMLDAFIVFGKIAAEKFSLNDILPAAVTKSYSLLTIHRPSNTDDKKQLQNILSALGKLSDTFVWPVHPRNKQVAESLQIPNNVKLFPPFSYFEMMVLLNNCNKVITDSGGLQKEAYWAKKPCITIREETEWVETLTEKRNILTGNDTKKIITAFNTNVNSTPWSDLYGDGTAADKIAGIIQKKL